MEALSHLVRYITIIALYLFIYHMFYLMRQDMCHLKSSNGRNINGKLKILSEPENDLEEKAYDLSRPIKIGRDQSNHMVIDHEDISQKDAVVFLKNTKAFIYKTKGSGHIYVNGERMKNLKRLKKGTLIEVGGVILEYEE